MTDADALLAAIRENPADDALRLMYADALQESGDTLDAIMQRIIAEPGEDRWRLDYAAELERTAGESRKCESCDGSGEERYADAAGDMDTRGCAACGGDYTKNGTGRVSDGRAELAAFVRVQVRIGEIRRYCSCGSCVRLRGGGQNTNGPCAIDQERIENADGTSRQAFLRNRERELWTAVRVAFEGYGIVPAVFDSAFARGEALPTGNAVMAVSRGLPTVARCTIAEWMGDVCRCGVTIAGLVTNRYPWKECPNCHGTGRTPGIGPRLAQRWPIERVETGLNLQLFHISGGYRAPSWLPEQLPPVILEIIRKQNLHYAETPGGEGSVLSYLADSPDNKKTLSDAMILWARQQVI